METANQIKMKPLVSVIIPNYNHARYLDERIQSVLNQTFQDFEVIILDDCSPDDGASRNVIERYRNNPHVSHIVYNDVNSGSPFKQWHKGIELAKGDLIWLAESDDSCDHHLLEKLIRGFEQADTVFSFCRSCIYDTCGRKKKFRNQSVFKESFCLPGNEFVSKYLMRHQNVANASSVVFKKGAALAIDKQYLNMRGPGDWLFWIELSELGSVSFIDEELNYFRLHDTNTTYKLMKSGVSQIETLIIFNYLMAKFQVSWIRKFSLRLSFMSEYQEHKYANEEIRSMVLQRWDPYYFYRLFLLPPFRVIVFRVIELIEQKQN